LTKRREFQAIVASLGLLTAPSAVMADDVPDALSVEWQGKKPCEKLFEDAQVRVARCTFPPGAVHACHSHPSSLTYVVSGGKVQVQDEKGARKIDIATGAFVDAPPTPWHEFTNIGETMVQVLPSRRILSARASPPTSPSWRGQTA
jgi:quercetin dioxygenase-like cupin family protein